MMPAMKPKAEELPPRILEFHRSLIRSITPIPGAEVELLTLDLPEALMVYMNWAHRFIKPRRRSVEYAAGFWRSKAALERGGDVLALEAAVKSGVDLGPHLSHRVFTDGFAAPNKNGKRRRGPDWADKDFALNAYNIHHLHFAPSNGRVRGQEPGSQGHLLYAEFARHSAFFLMVGDHKSFDDGTLDAAVIEARAATGRFDLVGIRPPRDDKDVEYQLRLARRGMATSGVKDGKVIMGAFLSTAGTSYWHTRHADQMHHALSEIDPKLDDRDFAARLFTDAGLTPPVSPQFVWRVEYTELSVTELSSRTKFIMVDGLN